MDWIIIINVIQKQFSRQLADGMSPYQLNIGLPGRGTPIKTIPNASFITYLDLKNTESTI